jgi:hypothetical protein
MGAEDVLSIPDPQQRELAEQEVRNMYVEAKRMIREESGVREIEKLFRRIHKPRLASPVIDRIRYLRAHPREIEQNRERDDGV